MIKNRKIAVIGMGYVGLPVAVAFGEKYQTVGFDVNKTRISELNEGHDRNREFSAKEIQAPNLTYSSDPEVLAEFDFFIVAVPTPITNSKLPDLSYLCKASETVGKYLNKRDIVVYESTVYPGATEDVCVPILEQASGLVAGQDFKVGYSPERINPGDTTRPFAKIRKIVSGQDEASLEVISQLYQSVLEAPIHPATSIKVAEAAKVIENTQRDLNIALMNELALIFDRLDIDTNDVIEAAQTKWNFHPYKPGLVGGHCISVDPYYLTYQSEALGYLPQVIHAGRRVNNEIGKFIAQRTIKELIKAGKPVKGANVTILGVTFKENCADSRNTRVLDVINELKEYQVICQVCDPHADPETIAEEYGIELTPQESLDPTDALIAAVPHQEFLAMGIQDFATLTKGQMIFMDVKSAFRHVFGTKASTDAVYWRL